MARLWGSSVIIEYFHSFNKCIWSTQTTIDHFRNCAIVSRGLLTVGKRKRAKCIKCVVPEMPVSCCAVNCTNRFSKGSGVGFFQFPVDPRKKELWIRAISRVDTSGRKWEPSVHDRICGVHFVSGRPSKDESAIDYVPTIFRDAKLTRVTQPERRGLRRGHGIRQLTTKCKTLQAY